MKRIRLSIFTLLLISICLLPATAQLTSTLEGHTDIVWSVAFRPNGVMLASASWDKTVRLWNTNTGRLLRTLTEHTNEVLSVAFSPDGQTLASADWDGTIVLWNPNNGKIKRTLTGHAGGVASVVFSPDGQTLASGSADRTIRLWNPNNGKLKTTFTGHTDVVEVVAFSPDGRTLVSGSRDATIRLWDTQNGKSKSTLTEHTAPVDALAFSPDGQTLTSGSRDRTIRLWDPHTRKLKTTLAATTDGVNPVAFSPDGQTLLIGGHGISVWDTETGQYKLPLAGNVGGVISVVFSPDGQRVAAGSADRKIRLWEFNASDYEIPSITANGLVRLVYFLPNDRPVRPERVSALRRMIKEAQQFFANEMERHGFGRKTFSIETDKAGEPVVHRIDGKFNEDYYNKHEQKNPEWTVWEEIVEHFDDLQHIYFIAEDVSDEIIGKDACGIGAPSYFSFDSNRFASVDGLALRHRDITQGDEILGGMCVIPASGLCFEDNRGFRHKLGVTTHELGHTFGLEHDIRKGHEDTILGGTAFRLSKCDAEWLSVNRFFNTNTKPILRNKPGEIQLHSIQTYNQDVINLHFEVTDPDGLHQAHLLVPTILEQAEGAGWGAFRLFDCKELNGKTGTVASAIRTAEIIDRVTLQIMDVNGYITWATFPIQLDEAVSDRNVLDVNNDGIVNISDLTPIDSRLGKRGQNSADVNRDNVVNTVDLLLVAANLSSVSRQAAETFEATKVQKWLTNANQLSIENEYQLTGVVFLQRLLAEIELLSKPIAVARSPMKAIFEGHTDFVWSVVFSPDGETLVSGSRDRSIRLWDILTRQLEMTLIETTDFYMPVAISPDGQTLASSSLHGSLRLWNPENGKHIRTLTGHKDWVSSIAFSPDGQTLASGGAGGQILLRDTDTWQLKETLKQDTHFVEVIAFSPDSKTLASGSRDPIIQLWNPNNGKLKGSLTGHTDAVMSIAFSPDGQTLVSGGRDRTIRLWNPETGKLKTTLTGYTDWINPVAFSPDGQYLACGRYNTIHLWNTQTGEYKNISERHKGHILSVAFSPDGTTLASGSEDNTVLLWDFQTLLEQTPTLETGPNKITGPWLWMIAPTRDGQGGARSNNIDSLAVVSGGNVTESTVAANGVQEGDAVGNYMWTLGEIADTGDDNINDVINTINMAIGDIDDHSSYALITLESATPQSDVTMRAGSDDSIKIWLNGEVVHNNPINRGAEDYQDKFTVDLKEGNNLLLVKVSEREGGWSMFVGIDADVNAIYKRPPDPVVSEDVNGDGIVNILDLVSVSSNFGKTGQNIADVNGDGIVNIVDLVKVAGEMGAGAAAPAAHPQTLEILTATDVQHWLAQAQHANLTDANSQRGILMLQQLLAALIPKETSLLPNYPNPFNPETWIPYQLSEAAELRVSIHSADGRLVRTLVLGQLPAGVYAEKNRAAYWDGRNEVGEPVASGVYFYTLSAGDFTATRKMLIRK